MLGFLGFENLGEPSTSHSQACARSIYASKQNGLSIHYHDVLSRCKHIRPESLGYSLRRRHVRLQSRSRRLRKRSLNHVSGHAGRDLWATSLWSGYYVGSTVYNHGRYGSLRIPTLADSQGDSHNKYPQCHHGLLTFLPCQTELIVTSKRSSLAAKTPVAQALSRYRMRHPLCCQSAPRIPLRKVEL